MPQAKERPDGFGDAIRAMLADSPAFRWHRPRRPSDRHLVFAVRSVAELAAAALGALERLGADDGAGPLRLQAPRLLGTRILSPGWETLPCHWDGSPDDLAALLAERAGTLWEMATEWREGIIQQRRAA